MVLNLFIGVFSRSDGYNTATDWIFKCVVIVLHNHRLYPQKCQECQAMMSLKLRNPSVFLPDMIVQDVILEESSGMKRCDQIIILSSLCLTCRHKCHGCLRVVEKC